MFLASAGYIGQASLPRARGRLGRSGIGGPVLHGRHGKEWLPRAGWAQHIHWRVLLPVGRDASRSREEEEQRRPGPTPSPASRGRGALILGCSETDSNQAWIIDRARRLGQHMLSDANFSYVETRSSARRRRAARGRM